MFCSLLSKLHCCVTCLIAVTTFLVAVTLTQITKSVHDNMICNLLMLQHTLINWVQLKDYLFLFFFRLVRSLCNRYLQHHKLLAFQEHAEVHLLPIP
jgi:hypothetical protein